MADEWKRLVVEAKKGDRGFALLIYKLEPVFRIIAGHIGSNFPEDDLVQAARIRIWHSLGKVKLKTDRDVSKIKSFLVTTGVNAMRDDIRKKIRYRLHIVDETTSERITARVGEHGLFDGLLLEYEKFIIENGKFDGAHKHLADKYGVGLWKMRLRFHKAVKKFLLDVKNS